MAWLSKSKGGYVVRWREGGRNSPTLSTAVIARKDHAIAKKKEIEDRLTAARPISPGADLSLRVIIAKWKDRQLSRGARELHVNKSTKRIAKLCESQGWESPRDLSPAAIERWQQKSSSSPRAGAMLRSVLRWAKESLDQNIDDRTLIALRPQPKRRRPKAPLLDNNRLKEIQNKADSFSPAVGALIHCLVTYGWRPITAADLTVNDFDHKAGTITTKVKGGDEIRHPLLEETIERLRPLVKNKTKNEPLFVDPRSGTAWNPDSSSAGSIIGFCRHFLGVKSYDLKRVAISRMLARGLPPQTVALFTGHRTISQVLTYARTNEDEAREALNRLR